MKIKLILIGVFTLGSLNALASDKSKFLDIFEPYIGSTFALKCGTTLSKAKTAEINDAVLEVEDRADTPTVKLETNENYIAFRSLHTSSDRFFAPYGGDFGGKNVQITNELNGKIFTQTLTEKTGLIFKTKSYRMTSTLNFSNAKEWIYSAVRTDFPENSSTTEICLLSIKK